MQHYPKPLIQLIESLKTLPGIGTRSAERFAFHLLSRTEEEVEQVARSIAHCKKKIPLCQKCGTYTDQEDCLFCRDPNRNQSTLCIVAYPKDVFAIEQTQAFNGLYHVLGSLLSPMDGKGPETLQLPLLIARMGQFPIEEIIIAIDSTVEGDATALYLHQELNTTGVTLSRVAFGLPLGSAFEYVDPGTLASALHGRKHVHHSIK